jgi:triosephosphate isomerase
MAQRDHLIVANWKMHKTSVEAADFVRRLAPKLSDVQDKVWLAVPFTALESTCQVALNTAIQVGAQNMHDEPAGAFTGEISASMLRACGAHFVILGHSERRQLFGETDAFINRKVLRALASNLAPLLCVGETLKEREAGLTEAVVARQLAQGLADVSEASIVHCTLAYEPVWAIGNGHTASPQNAQAVHAFLRNELAKNWGSAAAERVPILYGGSVKPSSAASLMAEADIDGLLVGGASLDVETFAQIIHYHSFVSGS